MKPGPPYTLLVPQFIRFRTAGIRIFHSNRKYVVYQRYVLNRQVITRVGCFVPTDIIPKKVMGIIIVLGTEWNYWRI